MLQKAFFGEMAGGEKPGKERRRQQRGLPLDEGNYNCPGKEWIDLWTYGQADFLAMKLREHEEVETVGDIEFAEDGREVIS